MAAPSVLRYQDTIPAPGVSSGIPVAINPSILASNVQLMHVMNAASRGETESKNVESPATTSVAHDRMKWRIFLMESLLGGTETMRAAGKTLLPMYTAEKQGDWQTRLSQAVLFNYTERTSSDLSGRLFKTPPKHPEVEDGLDPLMVRHFEDVNGEGTGLDEYLLHWFRGGFNLGLYHVLINTPKTDTTSAADRKTPTWSFVHPDNLLFAHETTLDDGTVIIDHARILEVSTEMQGFKEVEVKRIRVIEPGRTTLFKFNPEAMREEDKWVFEEGWDTEWDRVPLVTFYSNRVGFMEAVPPLQDLAYLNARHWQSYSDQINILTIARFPILAATGSSNSRGAKTIAPRKMFNIPDANGKLFYVEHTGAAIRSGTEDLQMLEEMMSNYGSEFLKSRPGSTAATSRALDSAESTSMLNAIAASFEDAVHELLVMTMRAQRDYTEGEVVPRVEFVVDLSMAQTDSTELTTLDLARRRFDISRKQFMNELSRRDILSDTYDADSDWEQIQKELKDEMALGIFVPKDRENSNATPELDNASSRAAEGKSSRGKPDNGQANTGEGDSDKDEEI